MPDTREGSSVTKIRVLLVDDHQIIRVGMRAIVDSAGDMIVVAEAATADEGIAAYEQHRPDVTVMDLRLQNHSGADAIEAIRKKHPDAKVMVLTSYHEGDDVIRAADAGAQGFVLKGAFRAGILEAIRAINAGQRVIPKEVAATLANRGATRRGT